MRGFSPLINVLLTILAAATVFPLLGKPWFAGAMDTNDGNQGSIELMGEAIGRWFTAQGATSTGADVLSSGGSLLLAACGVTVVLTLGMLIPGLRANLRGVLKMVPVAAPLIVVASILSQAAAAGVEPRWGGFATLAMTLFMASAAGQAAELRERKAAPKAYAPGAGRAF